MLSEVTIGLLAIAIAQIVTLVMAVINKLDATASRKVAASTHILVNSRMGAQLRMNLMLAEHLSRITQEQEFVDLASLAKKELDEYMAAEGLANGASRVKP